MGHFDPTEDERSRELRLPHWALKIIDRLRNDVRALGNERDRAVEQVTELQAQIATAAESNTGPEDSDAWLWRGTDDEVLPALGLGKGAMVDFTPTGPTGVQYTVECGQDGYLKVTSPANLMVVPIGRGDLRIKAV
jgi:hypothetical protein